MNRCFVTLLLTAGTAAHAGAQTQDTTATWVRTASSLEYQIVTEGRGRQVQRGDTVVIHEALSLPDGRIIFDSRVAPNKPVTFTLGASQVIPGVDEGVTGMRVGERRLLIVPPPLSKRKSYPANTPRDSTLHIDVLLVQSRPD